MTLLCHYCPNSEHAEDLLPSLCDRCESARDAHPAWQAIQRVERGEATVRRRGDLGGVYWWGFYWLETSDGWRFNIYSRGEPFADWRYCEAAIAPDGTRYEADYGGADKIEPGSHPLPASIWGLWSPRADRKSRERWALLPSGWSRDDAAVARVEAGGDP